MAKMTDYGNNIAGLRRAIRSLPKEAVGELRDAAQESGQVVADDAKARASGLGGAWRYLGPTIRAERGRTPGVKLGGKRRIPGRSGENQTVGDLLMGTEFGGGARATTRQFRPHLGQTGYALWPAVRARSDETMERYSTALLHALEAI